MSFQRRQLAHGDHPGLKASIVHAIRLGSTEGVHEIFRMEFGYLVLIQFNGIQLGSRAALLSVPLHHPGKRFQSQFHEACKAVEKGTAYMTSG